MEMKRCWKEERDKKGKEYIIISNRRQKDKNIRHGL